MLDNGLKALLISDYSGPATSEDEHSDGEDEGEEEEEDDDESGDETEEESEDDEDSDNEAKKKKGNAEKQVFLNVEHGFTMRQSCIQSYILVINLAAAASG